MWWVFTPVLFTTEWNGKQRKYLAEWGTAEHQAAIKMHIMKEPHDADEMFEYIWFGVKKKKADDTTAIFE